MHFKENIQKLSTLIDDIKTRIQINDILEATKLKEEAKELFLEIEKIADDKIEKTICINKKIAINSLSKQIQSFSQPQKRKKSSSINQTKQNKTYTGLNTDEDGNIALKCNWNDKNYCEPCSNEAYEYNCSIGRSWCCSSENNCRSINGDEVSLDIHPCYESIAIKEMYFGAGTNKDGSYRRIHKVKNNRIALLTTLPPGFKESERIIVGCIFIDKIENDFDKETKIYGCKHKSFAVDYSSVKIRFWDYYENRQSNKVIQWSSGLFRYISDKTIFDILNSIENEYRGMNYDSSKIAEMIMFYDSIINNK